jgi:hypothetical protein
LLFGRLIFGFTGLDLKIWLKIIQVGIGLVVMTDQPAKKSAGISFFWNFFE